MLAKGKTRKGSMAGGEWSMVIIVLELELELELELKLDGTVC